MPKLTLSVDEQAAKRAKRYARDRGRRAGVFIPFITSV